MMRDNLNENDAAAVAHSSLVNARASGKWMQVVYSFDEHGTLHMDRTTFNFPRGAFSEVERVLKEDIRREISNLLPDDPLPRVNIRNIVNDAVQNSIPDSSLGGNGEGI